MLNSSPAEKKTALGSREDPASKEQAEGTLGRHCRGDKKTWTHVNLGEDRVDLTCGLESIRDPRQGLQQKAQRSTVY